MERFKQTIAKLETDDSELKQFQTKIQGSTQSTGDIHYCTGAQEFGEYPLDEIDTFRFLVSASPGQNKINTYSYTLQNPTPELMAYLGVQGKYGFGTEYIPVDIDTFETYCMKKGGTPFVLTDEIRKCLDSKLWEFAVNLTHGPNNSYRSYPELYKDMRTDFYIDIPIHFKNTYKISPHVSFYITPLLNTLDDCVIHEISTKQVVFRIKYGVNIFNRGQIDRTYKNYIYSALKLHYSINGVVEQNDNLLD
jgi:hypothetical protein